MLSFIKNLPQERSEETLWKPLKIYDRPERQKKSFYVRHCDSREIKKSPQFHHSVPVYLENPKYLEYYSASQSTKIARAVQVGDVVSLKNEHLRYGECLQEVASEVIEIALRNGERQIVSSEELEVVYHGIVGMAVKDTEGLIASCKINAKYVEELNHAISRTTTRAREWLMSHQADMRLLDETLILTLHEKMFGEIYRWGGRYRDEDLFVGRRNWKTPVPKEIPPQMTSFVKEELPRIFEDLEREKGSFNHNTQKALASLYFRFCEIHPFKDGNGRISRLLMQFLLFCNSTERSTTILDWDKIHRLSSKMDRAFECARGEGKRKPLMRLIEQAGVVVV